MAKPKRPDMGENLAGFDGLYKDAAVDSPKTGNQDDSPKTADQSEAAATVPEAPQRARKAPEAPKTPKRAGKTTEPPPKAKWGEGKIRDTRSFSLTNETFERMRRYSAAKGFSMSEVAEVALSRALDRAEEANGGPFPPVPEKMRGSMDDL